MILVYKLISHGIPLESYTLTDEEFLYNDTRILVKDKKLKLLNLFGLTTEWIETSIKDIHCFDGVYVCVNIKGTIKEYFFDIIIPENFNVFIYQIKEYFGR